MDKTLIDSLQLLGLTAKEIKFFSSSYKLGSAPIADVAKHARLQRSTAYLIAEELLQKGLLEEDYNHYRKKVIAIEPQKVLRMLSTRQRVMQRKELEFKEKLGELQALYTASEIRPKVRVFQGTKGLLTIWEDIIASGDEILLWTNQETESLFFTHELHTKFIRDRIAKKIPVRVLAIQNKKGEKITSDPSLLRQTRFLPKETEFSAETYIYGNKIAILDYKKDIIGIIIESEPISNTQRAIFEMSWNNSE